MNSEWDYITDPKTLIAHKTSSNEGKALIQNYSLQLKQKGGATLLLDWFDRRSDDIELNKKKPYFESITNNGIVVLKFKVPNNYTFTPNQDIGVEIPGSETSVSVDPLLLIIPDNINIESGQQEDIEREIEINLNGDETLTYIGSLEMVSPEVTQLLDAEDFNFTYNVGAPQSPELEVFEITFDETEDSQEKDKTDADLEDTDAITAEERLNWEVQIAKNFLGTKTEENIPDFNKNFPLFLYDSNAKNEITSTEIRKYLMFYNSQFVPEDLALFTLNKKLNEDKKSRTINKPRLIAAQKLVNTKDTNTSKKHLNYIETKIRPILDEIMETLFEYDKISIKEVAQKETTESKGFFTATRNAFGSFFP